VEPRDRPGAANLHQQLLGLRVARSGSSPHTTQSDDGFFDLENPDTIDAPTSAGNPTIQSALRFLGDPRMKRGGLLKR
jgi:hypothetical protein